MVVAIAAAVLLAGQVASAEGGQVKRKDFALIGLVEDVGEATLDVRPTSGYWVGGTVVTISVTGETRFAPSGVSLSTLSEGDEVRTSGRLVSGALVAEVVALAP